MFFGMKGGYSMSGLFSVRACLSVWTVLLGLSMSMSVCAETQAAPVSICHEDEDNFPWFIKNGKGASVILMEMAAATAGIPVELKSMPWKRCLLQLERGDSAAALGASYTEERAYYAVYPMSRKTPSVPDEMRRLRSDEYALYRAVGSSLSWDGKALSGVLSGVRGKIGYQTSFSIGEQLKKWGIEAVEGSKSPEVILRRVLMGSLQGAALQTAAADHLLSNPEFSGKIEKIDPPLTVKSYFLVFGKDYYSQNERPANALWVAIEQARNSAEYQTRLSALIGQRPR